MRSTWLIVVAAVLHAVVSSADPLLVDFGSGALQAEYDAFGATAVRPAVQEYASALGVGGSVSVALSGADMDWRDRQRITAGPFLLSRDLLCDFVFVWASSSLELRLSTLTTGHYRVTTFHHDTEYADHGALTVVVTDAIGTTVVATNVVQSAGPGPLAVASVQFDVVADGVQPIVVRFEVVPGSGNAAVLNGFGLSLSSPIGITLSSWSAIKMLYVR